MTYKEDTMRQGEMTAFERAVHQETPGDPARWRVGVLGRTAAGQEVRGKVESTRPCAGGGREWLVGGVWIHEERITCAWWDAK